MTKARDVNLYTECERNKGVWDVFGVWDKLLDISCQVTKQWWETELVCLYSSSVYIVSSSSSIRVFMGKVRRVHLHSCIVIVLPVYPLSSGSSWTHGIVWLSSRSATTM